MRARTAALRCFWLVMGTPSAAAGPDPTRPRTRPQRRRTRRPGAPRGPDPLCPRTAGGVGNRSEGVAWGSPRSDASAAGGAERAAPPPRRGAEQWRPADGRPGGSIAVPVAEPGGVLGDVELVEPGSLGECARLLRRQRLCLPVNRSWTRRVAASTGPVGSGRRPPYRSARPSVPSTSREGPLVQAEQCRRRIRRCRRRRCARPASWTPWTPPARPAAGGPVRVGVQVPRMLDLGGRGHRSRR